MKIRLFVIAFCLRFISSASAFEGRIAADMTRGGQTETLLYTVSADFVRVEIAGVTKLPMPVDIMDAKSGQLTLLFPQNRSFVRLPAVQSNAVAAGPPMRIAAPGPGGFPSMPAMPMMPGRPMPGQKMELHATGQTTNILGFQCGQYEIKQRGQTWQIWATDQLLPFKLYVRKQPHRGSPRTMEGQWPELLAAQKLFPLRLNLRRDNGVELLGFEVKSVAPEKLSDENTNLFQPPAGYFETKPSPF
jgi:hypothetical protein